MRDITPGANTTTTLNLHERIVDINDSIDNGIPWEKREPVTIKACAFDSIRSQGITLNRDNAEHIMDLNKDDYGSIISVNGRPHMITDIKEGVKEEDTFQHRFLLYFLLPALVAIIGIGVMSLPGILYGIGDGFISSVIIITLPFVLIRFGLWVYRTIAKHTDTPYEITAIPLWMNYPQELTMVKNHNRGRLLEFIDSVYAACFYGNQSKLATANDIAVGAEHNWRTSFNHPEDKRE